MTRRAHAEVLKKAARLSQLSLFWDPSGEGWGVELRSYSPAHDAQGRESRAGSGSVELAVCCASCMRSVRFWSATMWGFEENAMVIDCLRWRGRIEEPG